MIRPQLNSIQVLRATAAILVAYAHSIDLQILQIKYPDSIQQHFYYLQNFGAFGVDIFFVISGFIISYSAGRYKGGRDGYAFLLHRFKRINPVYYIATLLFIAIRTHSWIRDGHSSLTGPVILKSIVLLPVFDRTSYTPTLLSQAWTLSLEWLFYLLFLVTILTRTRHKERLLGMITVILVIAGLFLHGGDYRLQFITNPVMGEFMLGVLIYWCWSRIAVPKSVAWALLLTGTGLCIGEIIKGFGNIDNSIYTLDGSLAFTRLFWWGTPAALLVAGCLFLEKKGSGGFARGNPLLLLIGNSSYSLYLLNPIVYGICASIYRRTGFFMNPDLAIFVQLALAIIVSIIFYKRVEAPLLRRLRKSPYSISTTLPR